MKTIWKYIWKFLVFWYRFIFGDDVVSALIVIAGFVAAIFLAAANGVYFWFMPVVVALGLAVSLIRKARSAEPE